MLLDHFAMTFILVPFLIITFIVLQLILGDSYFELIGTNTRLTSFIFISILIIYFLKDSYRGKSIGKRVIGLQVINRTTNKPANEFQCFVRNLIIPIWPLEVLITMFSPSIRLGDLLANTKVIVAEKEKLSTISSDIKKTKFTILTLLILIVGILYSFGLSHLFSFLVY